jgi:hypothetical protein
MMNTHWFVDQFTTLDDLPAKDRRDDDVVLHHLRLAGRFSIFDATEHEDLARTLTRLERNGRLKTDNSCGYPWIDVVEIDGERVTNG